jgi:endonuclease-3
MASSAPVPAIAADVGLPEDLLREADRRMRGRYGVGRLWNRRDPLAETVFIVLSAQTEEYNYRRTYRRLRRRFPTWERVLAAAPEQLAETIVHGGLAKKKARQIQSLLAELMRRRGELSLEFLRAMETETAIAWLMGLPGVGPKTAACVALYSLDRPTFPVDTHVWRIFARLAGRSRTAKQPTFGDQRHLEAAVPVDLRYSLHVNLIRLGRDLCHAKAPMCSACPIRDLCAIGMAGAAGRSTQVTDASSSITRLPPSAAAVSMRPRRAASHAASEPGRWLTATRAEPRREAAIAHST